MKLSVKVSAISGRGIFAEQDIRRGEHIYHLDGERVSLAQCVGRVARGTLRIDDPLPIRKYEYIVLDDFSVLFNHNCEANAAIVGESDLVALVDIPAGQEITFDYSLTVRPSIFTRFWRMPCKCRAATCRGSIGDVRTIQLERLQAYVRAGALQDFILDAIDARGPIDRAVKWWKPPHKANPNEDWNLAKGL